MTQSEHENEHFTCPDFIVADENAMIVRLESKFFLEIDKAKKKSKTILDGI